MRTCLAIALVAVAGCQPTTSSVDPSYALFERVVVPVLERRCATGAGCHGLEAPDPDLPPEAFAFPFDPRTGRIPAWGVPAAFETARLDHARLELDAAPFFSHLLRVPLAESYGGLPHAGMEIFATPDDPDYRALAGWIAAEQAAADVHRPPTSPAGTFFHEQVLGVLVRNGCFLQACHGALAFNDLKLLPPQPRGDLAQAPADAFSPTLAAENRHRLLGEVVRFANLGGDLRQSRLILKNLPVAEGGVHQRGGNRQFFESFDDPDVQVLLRWLRLEQRELAATLRRGGRVVPVEALGRVEGVVFVRAPRHAPRRPLSMDPFHPGAELMIAPEGEAPRALTAGRFDAPIDIQGVDVRHDARAVVFAARAAADAGFRVYEITLDDALTPMAMRRLTDAPLRRPDGALVHHVDPLYTPAEDRAALDEAAVVFASNQDTGAGPTLPFGLLGEADGGSPGVLRDRQRTERAGSLTGRRLFVRAGPHAGATRRVAEHLAGGRLRLDAPLDAAPDRRTVYEIEQPEAGVEPGFDLWRTVPGRPGTTRRITWNATQARFPTMRSTGEVLFSSLRNVGYQGGKPVFNGAIYRVQPGGFDYHVHGQNRSGYALMLGSRELPSGLEVRVGGDPRSLWSAGVPLLADHGFGVHVEPDNPVDSLSNGGGPLDAAGNRFLPALLPLFEDIAPTGVSAGGAYRDLVPLSDGSILAAYAPGPLDHLDPGADPDFDLVRLWPDGPLQSEDGQRAGRFRVDRLARTVSGAAEHTPRPVVVRPPEGPGEPRKWTTTAAPMAARAADGVERVADDQPGLVECYDYPLLQSFLVDFTPVGARRFRDDALRAVRIIARDRPALADATPVGHADPFATRASLGVHTPGRVVAEVPVEADGSFAAVVPPGVPLKVQGLDAHGRALHAMNRWFYVQPGEKLTFSIPRSIFPSLCAGCHGGLTGEPVDTLGPPDSVTSASKVAANHDPVTKRRRPPPPMLDLRVDFRRDVQPILDRRCVRCHGGAAPAAGLDLRGTPTAHYTVAYEALHALEDPEGGDFARKRYLDERAALAARSPLTDLLLPPSHHGATTVDERTTLIRWIDLGATFLGATR